MSCQPAKFADLHADNKLKGFRCAPAIAQCGTAAIKMNPAWPSRFRMVGSVKRYGDPEDYLIFEK